MTSASSHLSSSSIWREFILEHFPNALSCNVYTVPLVHLNRVPYALDIVPCASQRPLRVDTCSQTPVQPPPAKLRCVQPPASLASSASPPQVRWPREQLTQMGRAKESDSWDNIAQARVIRNLEKLWRQRQEVMFVLSKFKLKDCLSKPKCSVAVSQLPHPSQVEANFSLDDFDILIVHRSHGVLIGKMKSVPGHTTFELNLSKAQSDAAVVRRVGESLPVDTYILSLCPGSLAITTLSVDSHRQQDQHNLADYKIYVCRCDLYNNTAAADEVVSNLTAAEQAGMAYLFYWMKSTLIPDLISVR